MKITKADMEEFYREEQAKGNKLKKALRTAKASDFQIVSAGEAYPYAASLFGCYDIAVFKRKVDAKRFIETFGSAVETRTPGKQPDGSEWYP